MAIGSELTCVLGNQSHDEVDKDHSIKLKSNPIIIIIIIMMSKDYAVGLKACRGRSSSPRYETLLLRSRRQ